MRRTVRGQEANGLQPDREFYVPFSVIENEFQQEFLPQK
jgi:hypothetical protein